MKQRITKLLAVTLFIILSSAGTTRAQSHPQMFTRIPFDFYVRDHRFAAGDYYIRNLSSPSGPTVMRLRSKGGRVSRIFITTSSEPVGAGRSGEPALLFNRYGTAHFLAEIQNPPQEFSAKLSKVKSERDLAKQAGESQTVTVRFRPAGDRAGGARRNDGAGPVEGRPSDKIERTVGTNE